MWPEPWRRGASREDLAGLREEEDLVCSGCHNKYSWQLEVQDQSLPRFLVRLLFLDCGWPLSCCVFTWSFLCECVQRQTEITGGSFYKDSDPTR